MGAAKKSDLEALLVKRGLGATLAGRQCALDNEISVLAAGTITELVPDRLHASGVTSTALRMAATHTGKIAWIDPGDHLDPATAARAGLRLENLLWVRGGSAISGLEAAQLAVQAGDFALVVFDVLDLPEREIRFPRSAWFRLLRGLERGRRTALLLLAPSPLSGTCADRVIAVHYEAMLWNHAAPPLLDGARIGVRLQATRRHPPERKPPGTVAEWTQSEFVA